MGGMVVFLIIVPGLIPAEVKCKLPSKIKACYTLQERSGSM